MTSAAPMTRQKMVFDYDDEDSCHEGNVDLKHLMNVYQQTHGAVPPPVGPHLGNPKPGPPLPAK